jgi:hypothetical protein
MPGFQDGFPALPRSGFGFGGLGSHPASQSGFWTVCVSLTYHTSNC